MERNSDVASLQWSDWILKFFQNFSMIGVIYIADMKHFLFMVFLLSVLCFVLASIIMVVVFLLTFVVVFATLSFLKNRVFVLIFMFVDISPRVLRFSVTVKSLLMLWNSLYQVADGVYLLSRYENRATSACLSLIMCTHFNRALYADFSDGNSFSNSEFYKDDGLICL